MKGIEDDTQQKGKKEQKFPNSKSIPKEMFIGFTEKKKIYRLLNFSHKNWGKSKL